jgi:hypothetical protein
MKKEPPTSAIIGGSVAIAGLGLSAYNSISQAHKANQIQKGLHDPVYTIPPEFAQNREIARQMAEQGTPQAVINNQTNQINQTQAQAIDAASKGNNPGASIPSIVRQGDQSADKIAAEDSQSRQNNQRYFIQQNAQMGNQELAKQQSDVFDKYTREFNQMQAYRGASAQNLNNTVQGAQGLGLGLIANSSNNSDDPNNPGYNKKKAYYDYSPVGINSTSETS